MSTKHEHDILACLLIDPGQIGKMRRSISPEDFDGPWHQRVYEGLLELDTHGLPVDLVNLGCVLRCSVRQTWDIGEWAQAAPSALHLDQLVTDWLASVR